MRTVPLLDPVSQQCTLSVPHWCRNVATVSGDTAYFLISLSHKTVVGDISEPVV